MICLDTSILIWGVRGFAVPDQKGMIERAKRFIELTEKSKKAKREKAFMVPAPVVAEYLIGAANTKEEAKLLEENFIVPAFDMPAAIMAAEIEASDETKALRASGNVTRQQLRVDAMIVAIARFNQAERIVTNDFAHFRRLAAGKIPVSGLPELSELLTQAEITFPDA